MNARDLIEAEGSKLPKGYRVTVGPEKLAGGDVQFVGRIWKDGNYIGSTPTVSEYKDAAREAGIKWAWQHHSANKSRLGEAEDPKTFLRSLRPKPIVPKRFTWDELERINDVLVMGPLGREDGDEKYLDCGLFAYYERDKQVVMAAPGAVDAVFDRNGMIKDEWLAEPHSQIGHKARYYWANEAEDPKRFLRQIAPKKITVTSTWGVFTVNGDSGRVLNWQCRLPSEPGYEDIVRFNLDEWRKFYNWKGDLPLSLNILDLGSWSQDGMYDPPLDAYRERFGQLVKRE